VFPFSFKNSLQGRQGGTGLSGCAALLQRLMPVLRRRGNLGNALEHLGSLPLTAQSSLALVRLQDETLLLGITPQTITLLTKVSAVAVSVPAPLPLPEIGTP
jgi:flagellar biogenesis protein FliO